MSFWGPGKLYDAAMNPENLEYVWLVDRLPSELL